MLDPVLDEVALVLEAKLLVELAWKNLKRPSQPRVVAVSQRGKLRLVNEKVPISLNLPRSCFDITAGLE